MAISGNIGVKTIAGYIGKTGTYGTLINTNKRTSLLSVAVPPGDGNMTTPYQKWGVPGVGWNAEPALNSTMDTGFYTTFNFDGWAYYGGNGIIDYYDSTSNDNCAYQTAAGGTSDTWFSGTYGTFGYSGTSNNTYTGTSSTTAGGYVGCLYQNAKETCMVSFPKPTKLGNSYETYYNSKKTMAFWYYCVTATPNAFCYAIADNQSHQYTPGGSIQYSGFILQRPSNRTNAFTLLLGDGNGLGSGDRRSHLGITNSLAQGKWNFVVIGMDGNNITTQSISTNYVCITVAGAGSRTTTNNGISGTSGSATSIGLDSNLNACMRWMWSGNALASVADQIGGAWIFSEYLQADDSRLTDLWNATKSFYP